MGEKKKTKVEETTITPETWIRSTVIALVVVALTLGIWYFVSERD